MLLVVAVVAVMLGAEKTRRRWANFRLQAASHAALQSKYERELRRINAELIREERLYNAVRPKCGTMALHLKAIRAIATSRAAELDRQARLKEECLRRW
jgi:hypothetical protein